MSVKLEFNSRSEDFILVHGARVFLDSGEEIKGITKISAPEMNVESILEVCITVPVSSITVVEGLTPTWRSYEFRDSKY